MFDFTQGNSSNPFWNAIGSLLHKATPAEKACQVRPATPHRRSTHAHTPHTSPGGESAPLPPPPASAPYTHTRPPHISHKAPTHLPRIHRGERVPAPPHTHTHTHTANRSAIASSRLPHDLSTTFLFLTSCLVSLSLPPSLSALSHTRARCATHAWYPIYMHAWYPNRRRKASFSRLDRSISRTRGGAATEDIVLGHSRAFSKLFSAPHTRCVL